MAAWAEPTGDLPRVVVNAVSQGEAGNRVYLAVRDSLYARVALMFCDPRCDIETRDLVREYITGAKKERNPGAPI